MQSEKGNYPNEEFPKKKPKSQFLFQKTMKIFKKINKFD